MVEPLDGVLEQARHIIDDMPYSGDKAHNVALPYVIQLAGHMLVAAEIRRLATVVENLAVRDG